MSGNAIWSQPLPTGIPASSKAPLSSAGFPVWEKPMSGKAWAVMWPVSPISCTKMSTLVLVAVSALATDSVEGQRSRPSGVMRLDLLNEVGSRPAALARPEGERPARAASRSRAVQSCACVSIDFLAARGCGLPNRIYSPILEWVALCPTWLAQPPIGGELRYGGAAWAPSPLAGEGWGVGWSRGG